MVRSTGRVRLQSLAASDTRRITGHPAMASPSAFNGAAAQVSADGEMESPIHMIPLNEVLDLGAMPLQETSLEMRGSGAGKKRKKTTVRRSSTPLALQTQQPLQPTAPAPQTQSHHQIIVVLDAVAPPSGHFDPTGTDKEQVCMAVRRFLYDAGVPLEAVDSVHFRPMIEAIASAGGRSEVFSYHDFHGCILKKSLDEVTAQLEFYEGSWTQKGCSVLAEEWTTDKGRTLMNFSVYCAEGTMFLKSVEATDIVASSNALYELLKNVVEEVGEKNVVQLITNNSETHAAAGKRLGETFPTLFWSPCTFLCIDGMLEDFSKVGAISEIISNTKAITGFMYNSALALSLMKKHLHGKDLLVPAATRAAMNFVTLKTCTV